MCVGVSCPSGLILNPVKEVLHFSEDAIVFIADEPVENGVPFLLEVYGHIDWIHCAQLTGRHSVDSRHVSVSLR